ncbi:unnamed protein product, partial [marine sediment metagenome]
MGLSKYFTISLLGFILGIIFFKSVLKYKSMKKIKISKFKLPKNLPQIRIKKNFWAYMGVAAALIVGLIVSILID